MELKCLKKEREGEKVKVNDPGAVICIYSFVRLSLQCEQRYNLIGGSCKKCDIYGYL